MTHPSANSFEIFCERLKGRRSRVRFLNGRLVVLVFTGQRADDKAGAGRQNNNHKTSLCLMVFTSRSIAAASCGLMAEAAAEAVGKRLEMIGLG